MVKVTISYAMLCHVQYHGDVGAVVLWCCGAVVRDAVGTVGDVGAVVCNIEQQATIPLPR